MCGIIGYTGPLDAKNVILNGLSQLEYRGYDSAGIALCDYSGKVHIAKKTGKVENLIKYTAEMSDGFHTGIGHTRWATHGGVTDINAHPHRAGRITLIHNGIIENYHELTEKYDLKKKLLSETDTEVAAWVLDCIYTKDHEAGPQKCIREFIGELKGSFAFCIIFEDIPGEIYCVRNVSPLVASYCSSGAFVASDLTALIPYTKKYFVAPEYHIIRLTPYKIHVYGQDLTEYDPELLEVNWNTDAAMKNGYPHFMLKEIHEQPDAVQNTIRPRIQNGLPDFSDDNIPDDLFTFCNKIHIVACGTAMHAGMVSQAILEPLLRIPVLVTIASEFRYDDPLIDDKTLVIVISQSGETIDTLAALRLAREKKSKVLSLVNVKGSTIARESDYVLYTHAGPEIAVASTKAYSVQLAALYLLICKFGLMREKYTEDDARRFIRDLNGVIPVIESVLKKEQEIKSVVPHIVCMPDAFFIGRGLDYVFSLEGALKLKEISYIHAEAYAAGELKHGTIALIAPNVPVIAIVTQTKIMQKTISNIREVKARGGFVILLSRENAKIEPDVYDQKITIPDIDDMFTVFPIAVVLQLIAYYSSVSKNLDVDKPRNLAKSVTVE